MHRVEPQVFLIGETRIVQEGLDGYLNLIGTPEWDTDAPSDGEKLIEVEGRLCYKSFKIGLNPNVKRIREGNDNYIKNIIAVQHGSVIEHVWLNFVFANVSRIFTHELVRHRAGAKMDDGEIIEFPNEGAFSQESLRFVRLTDLDYWIPPFIAEDEEALERIVANIEKDEELQAWLANRYHLDDAETPFERKKFITSILRRFIDQGIGTSIGWSANLRTIRWLLEARTNRHAEEEIRMVFGQVGDIVVPRFPNIFADFTKEIVDGIPWYKPEHRKV
jgi:thymidylate synthase (FAD)